MTAATWIRRTCDFCGRSAGGAPADQTLEVEHVVVSAALVPDGIDLAGDMVSPIERRLDVCDDCLVHIRRALTAGVRAARRARVAAESAAQLRVVHDLPAAPGTSAPEPSQTAHATAHGG